MSSTPPKGPFDCPVCERPLENVVFAVWEVWEYDPKTGRYVEDQKAGFGETKCYHCQNQIDTEMQGFEEGPANYAEKEEEIKA